jgi:hypothetical protein
VHLIRRVLGNLGVIVLVPTVAAGILFCLQWLTRRSQVMTRRRSFWCPVAEREVTARVHEYTVGEPFEVVSCTAFEPDTALTCARLCLQSERNDRFTSTTRGV